MHVDILELQKFYTSPLGRLAERFIAMTLSSIWEPIADERLVGLGYPTPYLDRFQADAERCFAFMPAGQGSCDWPSVGNPKTALVYEEELPLPDSSIDRLLLVHCLEFTESPEETLKEMWRVLAPNGRLVVVVPNRRGMWARFENTPFGSGRPYSRSQLSSLLQKANYTVIRETHALSFPPLHRRWSQKAAPIFEKLGGGNRSLLAGVVIVEAQKRLYQGIPAVKRASRRVFVPVFAPQAMRKGKESMTKKNIGQGKYKRL